VPASVYDEEMIEQIKQVKQVRKITCVDELLSSGNTWEVTGNGNGNGKPEDCPGKKLK
jgi:2-oxoglutarate ferredoxin oxidoreductase subunit beta